MSSPGFSPPVTAHAGTQGHWQRRRKLILACHPVSAYLLLHSVFIPLLYSVYTLLMKD